MVRAMWHERWELLARAGVVQADSRSFDCVIVRSANDNVAQDDRAV
jgi:hypothetical protein